MTIEHTQMGQTGTTAEQNVSMPPRSLRWSIVSTMYRSREFLEAFLAECVDMMRSLGDGEFEIILVNDGSPDDSIDYVISRCADIRELVVVDLSRNFGHHNAIHAGLRHSRGEFVFLIDCDLEVRPAALRTLFEKLQQTRADMVFGYQQARKGNWFEQFTGRVFYRGINALSDVKVPNNVLTERVMSRRFVDAMLQMGDYNLFIAGMMSWTGYVQIGLPILKVQREGRSNYTLLKKLQLMVNAVSSFSSKPLTWLFNAGIGITLLSFSYVSYLIFRKIAFGDALLGFTSMMGFLAITLGVTTTALGVVGIYLGKVFNQVQNRPTYIVKDIHKGAR